MSQLKHIGAIEKRLWAVVATQLADTVCASNEYFLPLTGLVYLRPAHSRSTRQAL
jgi:type I restriction enzyme M protein